MFTQFCKRVRPWRASAMALLALAGPAVAETLVHNDNTHLNLDIQALGGVFHSQRNYNSAGTLSAGSSSWQEGYLKYGFSGDQALGGGRLFGAVNLMSTGTWGDGDAAGFTNGSERRTQVEDAYLGWRSGDLFPALGKDGLSVSAGRQAIVVGDGFLIAGDALNFGNGIADGILNRGGGYYLAARQAFSHTAVVSLGGKTGWHSNLMWLKSNNPAQAKAEMAVGTLEHVNDKGTLGLTYIKVLDTDHQLDFLYPQRNGMSVASVRGQGNAGVKNLFLAGQYAWEDQDQGNENAWYLEAGWTFSRLPGSPDVHYRFSRFSRGYDPLFYGNGRGLGTWFQGEVAANYAGPFNSNTRVDTLDVTLSPRDDLSVGLMMYRFRTLDKNAGPNLDAREADLYVQWTVNKHLALIPLVGLYKPEVSAADGGSQLGSSKSNFYSELMLSLSF